MMHMGKPEVLVGLMLGIIFVVIAFYIAAETLPDALITYYNGVESMANCGANCTTNVSTIVIVIFQFAPIGVPIALLLAFLGVGYLGYKKYSK